MSAASDEVVRIARLAHLDLDPTMVPQFASQLAAILDYVALMDDLTVGPADPAAGSLEERQILRADEPIPSLPRERCLVNAPDAADGLFRVPRVLAE